jgi:hypothetical protein
MSKRRDRMGVMRRLHENSSEKSVTCLLGLFMVCVKVDVVPLDERVKRFNPERDGGKKGVPKYVCMGGNISIGIGVFGVEGISYKSFG